ncbi:hypothetical protein H9655_14390 [Cytobacillus sp. Sa5YUA1]|uniref:Peptide ABC transporter permease n=1 Tax=Cytobacillus stercorigallinarum TaxID=2762240 RepID=A0ABR8QS42_9BACI|nr:hypothetical protein [Cytobacillus stercorigallinarum]MBD7938219.1 hypothetical protein [Cytobacillus stercorigallinarum]
MINQQLTEVTTIHTMLPNYWPHFIASPYAYYNHESIYLYHHPQFNGQEVILPWNNQFTGCTSIIFENEATAIVDINILNKEEVYATLIHELFHCHQYHKKETRFPNELTGMAYPLERENIQWRIQEREWLNQALRMKDINKQREAIQAFIYWRGKREEQYNEFVQYENLIETIEGPAFFIEYHAYKDIVNQPDERVLERYLKSLTDYSIMTNKIRHSCYPSGLAICLLLETFSPKWKEELFDHQLTLYEVLKQEFESLAKAPKRMHLAYSLDNLIHEAEISKEREISHFKETNGLLFTLIGQGKIQQFDPMNIIKLHKNFLHKNGMTIRLQEQSIYFSKPVLALTENGLSDVTQLQFFIDHPPEQTIDGISIDGIGHFLGELKQIGDNFQFILSK